MTADRRRGLGRGLDAIFSNSFTSIAPEHDTGVSVLVQVRPDEVRPNPEQPRRTFDEAELERLADSLRAHGMLQPIVVERATEGYQLVAGERRLRASQRAGLAIIPAIVRPASDSGRQALELALVENVQRQDLTALEEAAAYARLADTFGLSHEAIALRVGRSRTSITNTIRLLNLPAPAQEALHAGEISAGHARALLGLPDENDQTALLEAIKGGHLTVRAVEDAVRDLLNPGGHQDEPAPAGTPGEPPARPASSLSADDGALVGALEDALGTPVKLERRRRGGRLSIDFYDDEKLDELYRRLGGKPI